MPTFGDGVVTLWNQIPGCLHPPGLLAGGPHGAPDPGLARVFLYQRRASWRLEGIREPGLLFHRAFSRDPAIETATYKAADGRSAHVFAVKRQSGTFKASVKNFW
jgi:hypothetical protein